MARSAAQETRVCCADVTARARYLQVYAGVALCSGAGIAAQVAFTRIFSLTLWHHYAFLVLGVALSGFGIAGAWLTARGGALREGDGGLHVALGRRARRAALLSLVSLALVGILRFNSLHLFTDPSVVLALSVVIAASAVPFIGVGIIIGTALAAKETPPNRVYAADLLGAALAAVAISALLNVFGAPLSLIGATILIGLAGCVFVAGHNRAELKRSAWTVVLLLAAALGYGNDDHWLLPAFTKEIYLVHNPLMGTHNIEYREWTSQGRIDVSADFQGVPGLGGEVATPRPVHTRLVTQDGAAPTALFRLPGEPADLDFLFRATTSAVWHLRGAAAHRGPPPPEGPEMLVIGLGGGADALMGLAFGAGDVTGVDINHAMLGLHTDRFRDYSRLTELSGLSLVRADGRSFLMSTDAQYDVIQLSGVDTFTALSSGAYSLAEAYVYTAEAFNEYFAHLKPGGCLSMSRLILDPPRETLRLAATARDALAAWDDENAHRHIAILRGRTWATMVACARPIDALEMSRLRRFAERHQFQIAFDPERPAGDAFGRLLTGTPAARADFIRNHPYRVEPVTDEKPFFFDFFRPSQLLALGSEASTDHPYAARLPVGHGLMLASVFVTLLLSVFGIWWPLRRAGIALGPDDRVELRYFAGLGAGYLLVEVGLIQRLSFLLGHPTYGLTVVLGSLLGASGLGAALTLRLGPARLRGLPWLVGIAILATAVASYLFLPGWLSLPFGTRLGLSLLLTVPLGFVLGMPFPLGIARLRAANPAIVPWAFGTNAFFTVVASSAAPLLAMGTGFSGLLVVAALLYAVALVSSVPAAPQTAS